MTRTERLLRLARLRGDRAAIAILETAKTRGQGKRITLAIFDETHTIPETELRALWGDR